MTYLEVVKQNYNIEFETFTLYKITNKNKEMEI